MSDLEEFSTITAKGQTTIPKIVRQALGIGSGDRIVFRIDEHGVSVQRAAAPEEDPVISAFLAFLETDLVKQPDMLRPLTTGLADRIGAVTQGMDVDIDAPIDGDVDL